MRAIVVEDEPHIRALLAAVLKDQGIRVDAFGDGQSALDFLTQRPVQLAVLDWVMPGLDGLEVCRRIRRRPGGSAVFILVITARSSSADLNEALTAGADDYITKPLDLELLNIRLTIARQQAMQLMARQAAEHALRSTERQIRALMQSAPLGLLGVNREGYISIAEGRILKDLFHDANLRGRPLGALTDLPDLQHALQTTREGVFLTRVDARDYELHLSPDPDAADRTTIVVTEVTEHRRLERELEHALVDAELSYHHTLAVLDQLGVGMAVIDGTARVTFVNQSALRYLRLEPGEVVGKHWLDVLAFSDDGMTVADQLSAAASDRKASAVALVHSDRTLHFKLEVVDDPRDSGRRILAFYDTTEVFDLRQALHEEQTFHGFVGSSAPMTEVYRQVRDAGQVDWTVLVEGDTGTGKELVARAIHEESERRKGPFVAVNCAGLSVSLLQSQLFGHRKGAFTGAVRDQPGFFEAAHGGTLFLDEIGDIAAEVQTSLLRVLEERVVMRLGENKARAVDVRVIVATHRDLARRVEEGHFRADLLYRIRVVRVSLAPLRERHGDIPLLVSAFLSRADAMTGKRHYGVSQAAMDALIRYRWPGNVRELKAAIEYASTRSQSEWIQLEDLPPELLAETGSAPDTAPRRRSRREEVRQAILDALHQAGGNRSDAARLLGMSRATFYRRLRQLDISLDDSSFPGRFNT